MGIAYFLFPKTPFVIVISLIFMFILVIHPLWNCWWIEKSRIRQFIASLFFVVVLIILARSVWPIDVPHEQLQPKGVLTIPRPTIPKTQQTVKPTEKKEQRQKEQMPKEPLPASTVPQIVVQLPSIGNLKQRALALSADIMGYLHENGTTSLYYKPQCKSPMRYPMPKTPNDIKEWADRQSRYFM